MAFTCGFFNSVDGDRRYNSRQISQIFDGIIIDGVFAHYGTHFKITPLNGMEINVGEGRFWFNHVWGLNDGNTVVHLDPSDISSQRKDAIVIEINESDEVRNAFIKVLKGNTSGNKPTIVNTEDFHQYPLAYVTVPAGATAITASNIQVVVGTSECPFATGVLQNVNIDNLFDQWDAQFQEWFSDIQSQLEGNVVTNLINEINSLKENKANKTEVNALKNDISDGVYVNGKKYKFNVINPETSYVGRNTQIPAGYISTAHRYVYEENYALIPTQSGANTRGVTRVLYMHGSECDVILTGKDYTVDTSVNTIYKMFNYDNIVYMCIVKSSYSDLFYINLSNKQCIELPYSNSGSGILIGVTQNRLICACKTSSNTTYISLYFFDKTTGEEKTSERKESLINVGLYLSSMFYIDNMTILVRTSNVESIKIITINSDYSYSITTILEKSNTVTSVSDPIYIGDNFIWFYEYKVDANNVYTYYYIVYNKKTHNVTYIPVPTYTNWRMIGTLPNNILAIMEYVSISSSSTYDEYLHLLKEDGTEYSRTLLRNLYGIPAGIMYGMYPTRLVYDRWCCLSDQYSIYISSTGQHKVMGSMSVYDANSAGMYTGTTISSINASRFGHHSANFVLDNKANLYSPNINCPGIVTGGFLLEE